MQLKNLKLHPPPPQPSNTQSLESTKQGFCEEIETGIESKFIVFRGIIENSSDSQTTHTFGEVKGNARRITGAISSLIQKDKKFKMGDKTFIFDINAVSKISPLLTIMGAGSISTMMSALSSSSDINLEIGDEVILAATKDKYSGFYRVEALKNLSKDYHFSHIKDQPQYLVLLTICSMGLLLSFLLGLFVFFEKKDISVLLLCTFVFLPIFFVGRFFALRLLGVTKRKKLDKFIKDYVKP